VVAGIRRWRAGRRPRSRWRIGCPSRVDKHSRWHLSPGAHPAAAQAIGAGLPEFAAPLVDRVVGDAHAALGHHLLDITQAQREPVIQPHAVANDLHREPVTPVQRPRGIHQPRMVHTVTQRPNTPDANLTMPYRAVRHQSDRSRPRPVETTAATDARPEGRWRASHIPDSGPNKVRPGMEGMNARTAQEVYR
jgi:hypothetical protein